MAESFAPGQRRILNANKGVANVIEQDVINTDLKRVANNLFQVLKHHYGPYSGFAGIDDGQPLNETQFTKDGIGIVRAIEYASPQEEWVKKTIAYIGTRMEASVGDGTTSAMMFTCAMLRHMSEHINEIKPISYNNFRNQWRRFIEDVNLDIKEKYTFTPYTGDRLDTEKVYNIVYNQVYTSSHGDTGLAKAMAEMYKNTPPELWERMTYERCMYETDKDYEVIVSEGQYCMNADVMSTSMLNKDLCTWYEKDNVTLVVINDAWRFDSPDWPRIMHEVDNATADNPVVVVCHKIMDRESYQQINDKIVECDKAGKPFAVFTMKPQHPKVNDFVAIQMIAEQDILQFANGEALILKGTKVKFKNKKLFLDKLVKEPDGWKSNERFHVTDGKHSQFTDALETWKKQAENYTKQAMTREDREIANYFSKMYVKLRYTKIYTIVVGGKAYDNAAFVDVLDDAIRAASRALTHGITFGNNRSLYLVASQFAKNEYYQKNRPIQVWFAKRIIESLEDIAKVVLERLYPNKWISPWRKKNFVKWWFSHTVDLLLYDTRSQLGLLIYQNFEKIVALCGANDIAKVMTKGVGAQICQPSNSDTIMLERFGEVALKFILTERIIISGGAYVNKK